MATFNSFTDVTTGDVYTAAHHNNILENLGNHRVPPMCKVYQNTGEVINDASNTTLSFDLEYFDTDGMHDNSTNNSRITIVTAGVYLVIGSVRYTTTIDDDTRVSILKDTVNICIDERGPNNTRSAQQVMGYFDLDVGEYLELQVYQNNSGSGTRTIDTSYTWLSAAWIGEIA